MTGHCAVVDRIADAVGWTGAVAPKYDWDHVERRMKTPFPADHKEFMARFPSCFFRPDDWTTTRRSMTAVLLEFTTSRSTRNILGWDMSGTDRAIELF